MHKKRYIYMQGKCLMKRDVVVQRSSTRKSITNM